LDKFANGGWFIFAHANACCRRFLNPTQEFFIRRCKACRSSTSLSLLFSLLTKNRPAMNKAKTLMTRSTHSTPPHSSNIPPPQRGGRTSMSTSPIGHPMQPSRAFSSTMSSSRPGGSVSGSGTSPLISVIMHVPHVPEVQLVGMSTPANFASFASGISGLTVTCPSN